MKSPFIADLHHQVLPFWAALRRELGVPFAVLTLDYHTDVLPCSGNGRSTPDTGAWQVPAAVSAAVATLHHDEHLDWALRSGIASRIRLIHLAPSCTAPAHAKIELRRSTLVPAPEIILNAPEQYRPVAELHFDDAFLAPLLDGFPDDGEPFVLDVDCDYVLCENALRPRQSELFRSLCRRCAAATFSRENDWVKLLKLPGETITGTSIAAALAGRFRDFS